MGELRVDSPDNPRYKCWKALAKGDVKAHGRTLVAGEKLTLEVATSTFWKRTWIIPDGFDDPLPDVDGRSVRLASRLFADIDTQGTHFPLLEVQLPEPLPSVNLADTGIFIAVPFQDPTNVGAVIRSAVGLGAGGVFLLPTSAHPFHPRAVRTSAGAVFRTRFSWIQSLDEVEMLGFAVILLDAAGLPVEEFTFPERCVLAVGIEGQGIAALEDPRRQSLAGRPRCCARPSLRLPMQEIESYNAAAAAAMAMYEWRRRR